MKKFFAVLLVTVMAATALIGCGGNSSNSGDISGDPISVISREDGSGTRGAFVELFGVETKNADGTKTDNTTTNANIANSTAIVMNNVAGDEDAVGYISLGSLNDTVKALQINGAAPTVADIKSGSYEISRPFIIATKGAPSAIAQDFINFILSSDGQKVVADNGYIPEDNPPAFNSNHASGKVVIAGSSSVSPVMEKLQEAYEAVNTSVKIELQTSDSTTGLQAAMDGTADIGMSSRELKDSESELTPTTIATDGIVVIVNKDNPTDSLTKEEVKDIYTGVKTEW